MRSVEELEDRLSTPSPALIADLVRVEGDLLILGAGGKLGPSLARLALRAAGGKRVTVVSRFGKGTLAEELRGAGAEVIAADITDDAALARLPEAANVIFLVGAKFGSTGNEAGTWYTNAYLPGRVAERYRSSRIVALSTGNVYPFTPVSSGGPDESVPPAPVGEYAMSCLGRERVFSHFARLHGTRLALIRLNYAVEMRYGVLVDIARAVQAGRPVDVTMAAVNVVWQGYANEAILRSLLHASAGGAVQAFEPDLEAARLALGRADQADFHRREAAEAGDRHCCGSCFGNGDIGDALPRELQRQFDGMHGIEGRPAIRAVGVEGAGSGDLGEPPERGGLRLQRLGIDLPAKRAAGQQQGAVRPGRIEHGLGVGDGERQWLVDENRQAAPQVRQGVPGVEAAVAGADDDGIHLVHQSGRLGREPVHAILAGEAPGAIGIARGGPEGGDLESGPETLPVEEAQRVFGVVALDADKPDPHGFFLFLRCIDAKPLDST